MKNSYLLTGGARSGKSSRAEDLAKEIGGKVLYVATAEAGDDDMRERIRRHIASRPAQWDTLEASLNTGECILEEAKDYDVVIIDCLTMLANNVIGQAFCVYGENVEDAVAEDMMNAELNAIQKAMSELKADFIIVTNEVGLGIVPDNRISRLYRDVLGRANQSMAHAVKNVIFMVSGCEMYVKGAPVPKKQPR